MGKREELAKLQRERGLVNSVNNNPQAIDMFLGEEKVDVIKNISLDKLRPFKNHIFHLYQGERLDEMVKSIQNNGVITPIIVRQVDDLYEILSGHNRQNASKLAGLTEIPSIVKYDLSDEEAELITITTNLNQRSIESMLHSELAFALRRQNDILKHQGKSSALDHDGLKFTADKIGSDFKLSSSNVKRYIRLTYLTEELLSLVDSNKLNFVSGVALSFLRPSEMKCVFDYISSGNKITPKEAEILKKMSQESENEIDVKTILDGLNKPVGKVSGVKLSNKELLEFIPKEELVNAGEIIRKALMLYYQKG